MTNRKPRIRDRAARRVVMEQIVAQYPAISQDDLHTLFDYFRHEASPVDRAKIAANRTIRAQYRQFAADNRPEMLRPLEIGCYVVATFVLAVGLVLLALWR